MVVSSTRAILDFPWDVTTDAILGPTWVWVGMYEVVALSCTSTSTSRE